MTTAPDRNPNANWLKGTSLYLIGMMGAGKTTTGQQLADILGYRFLDTDDVIEQAAHQSIPEIFSTQGEAAFRDLETQVLAQVSAYPRLVVATGGGIVLQRMNWSYLHHGVVIWLDAPLNVLEKRLMGDTHRPLLQGKDWPTRLESLLSQRHALYNQADIHVSVAAQDDAATVAERVLQQLKNSVRPELKPPQTD